MNHVQLSCIKPGKRATVMLSSAMALRGAECGGMNRENILRTSRRIDRRVGPHYAQHSTSLTTVDVSWMDIFVTLEKAHP